MKVCSLKTLQLKQYLINPMQTAYLARVGKNIFFNPAKWVFFGGAVGAFGFYWVNFLGVFLWFFFNFVV